MRSFSLIFILTMSVVAFFSCGGSRSDVRYKEAESLVRMAYDMRYKNLDEAERLAVMAMKASEGLEPFEAEAMNNLGFCAFLRMDFERAESLFKQVYKLSGNELERLVADVGLMKICQRTSSNKEFYDYRNNALKRINRINADTDALADTDFAERYHYACSEFYITSSVYYYYLQQENQSIEAIDAVNVESIAKDTAQLLQYAYMKGSGGMYEAPSEEEVLVGEFDYLLDCLTMAHAGGYVYFEANASQAMAEMLNSVRNYDILMQRRPRMMRVINPSDLSGEDLAMEFAGNALKLFTEYGDWYQISGSYRTKASCLNSRGKHEEALECLEEALMYVNMHHEKYYHCHDSIDRLKTYVPMATNSIELEWINKEGIKTVPDWIARFREQLSVTYAALGMKPQSDYNRNIYLDLLDYTRQDKELENRYIELEKESHQLNMMLVLVVIFFMAVIVLLMILNRNWRKRNDRYIGKLKNVLEICRKITASVPENAEDKADVIEAIMSMVMKEMNISGDDVKMEITEDETNIRTCAGRSIDFPLYANDGRKMGVWRISAPHLLKKDEIKLFRVMVPYISWTLENGLALVSLDDEQKRLDKEQYVHEQHLVEKKRQNIVKKACLFLVTSISPYIDRVVNEVHKLNKKDNTVGREVRNHKYRYIAELIGRINEYNDILALWIKMRQGALNLIIENFDLDAMFDIIRKGKRKFEQKGITLNVEPANVVVKADKALTLFMINTLADNAFKYTPSEGQVDIYTTESEDYVEISVKDTGIGLCDDDVKCIMEEKVYDSGKIGVHGTAADDALREKKGWGFGLMNCRGVIEKYRKTNALFKVCSFGVESKLGEGSRFYFRLPKGVRKSLSVCVWLMCVLTGCASVADDAVSSSFTDVATEEYQADSLLDEANRLADLVYQANIEERYQDALHYADSALMVLNEHFVRHASFPAPLLAMDGEGNASELEWFLQGFETDYYALLDVRNEVAVASLALGRWSGYRYNNQAYAALYKLISVDTSLEDYCTQMQQSAGHKAVAIILCFLLLLCFVIGYYMLYFRHLIAYRDNLDEVLEINRKAFSMPVVQNSEYEMASSLVNELYEGISELTGLKNLAIAIYSEENNRLSFAFRGEETTAVKEQMMQCFEEKKTYWNADEPIKSFPLCIEVKGEVRCMGVMTMQPIAENVDEDIRLMLELIVGYVAIVVYNAIELVAQKYKDIEWMIDETRRMQREESNLHVQNQVLDNCLSTIKHETIYYPNRIKFIVDKLNGGLDAETEAEQVEAMNELVGYYREIYTILSACAARQVEEVTFKRSHVHTRTLAEHAVHYVNKVSKKASFTVSLDVEGDDIMLIGDEVLLKFLLENLITEAMAFPVSGKLKLTTRHDGNFVRMDFVDMRREMSQEELNQLFYPHLSIMGHTSEGILKGTEYLICKQIIREHDEYTGQRGCRINAEPYPMGGFSVWFTLPAKKTNNM